MTPAVLVSPDGTRRITVGASGGPWIISSTLQTILNIVDFEMDPAEAVSVPRVHHQWVPRRIDLDLGISADTKAALEALGHETAQWPFFSSVQVAVMGPDGVEGASDPRKGGWPAGLN
jgi:gamma-glutamyltranspeptidase/glutathione hydrolase